jgi:hypothetical protein
VTFLEEPREDEYNGCKKFIGKEILGNSQSYISGLGDLIKKKQKESRKG